ncbi:MAG: hypothetical protein ACM30G_02560 [Micromonosporaceae bacterium]
MSDHTRERRRSIAYAFLLVAIAVVATLAGGAIVNRDRQQETARADNALVALQQACDQVARLGGRCATPPSRVQDTPIARPGPAGVAGPPGRAPTQAEIAAAVAAYLAERPPLAGPPGEPGPPGSACPLLGYHLEVLTFRLVGADAKSRAILACVPD